MQYNYAGTILSLKKNIYPAVGGGDYAVCARMEVQLTAEDAGVSVDVAGAFCLVFF